MDVDVTDKGEEDNEGCVSARICSKGRSRASWCTQKGTAEIREIGRTPERTYSWECIRVNGDRVEYILGCPSV